MIIEAAWWNIKCRGCNAGWMVVWGIQCQYGGEPHQSPPQPDPPTTTTTTTCICRQKLINKKLPLWCNRSTWTCMLKTKIDWKSSVVLQQNQIMKQVKTHCGFSPFNYCNQLTIISFSKNVGDFYADVVARATQCFVPVQIRNILNTFLEAPPFPMFFLISALHDSKAIAT